MIDSQNRDFGGRTRHSFGGKGSNEDALGASTKQFGIGEFNLLFLVFLKQKIILFKNRKGSFQSLQQIFFFFFPCYTNQISAKRDRFSRCKFKMFSFLLKFNVWLQILFQKAKRLFHPAHLLHFWLIKKQNA